MHTSETEQEKYSARSKAYDEASMNTEETEAKTPADPKRPDKTISSRYSPKGLGGGTSEIEIRLRHEIGEFFDLNHGKNDRVIVAKNGKRYHVDILLAKESIIMEYDSSYYHITRKSRDRDEKKTKDLNKNGWAVIRIRERPLKIVSANDVSVDASSSIHQITVRTLERIENLTGIKILGLDEYRKNGERAAGSGAEAYMDLLDQRRAECAEYITQELGSSAWRTKFNKFSALPLSDIQSKVVTLKIIFKNDKWKSRPELLSNDSATLYSHSERIADLFQNDKWKSVPQLLTFSPSSLERKAAALTRILGNTHWKRQPRLLCNATRTLEENAIKLDRIFGMPQWRNQPQLLCQDMGRLEKNAADLTELTGGRRWKGCPSLLYQKVEKLELNAAALTALLGHRGWELHPTLLGRKTSTLKRKSEEIGRLLGNDRWKSVPQIFSYSIGQLRFKAAEITRVLGHDSWKTDPVLLCGSIIRLEKSASVLTAILGNDKWKTSYFHLITRSSSKKLRENARNLTLIFTSDTWKKNPALLAISASTVNRRWAMLANILGKEEALRVLNASPWHMQSTDQDIRKRAENRARKIMAREQLWKNTDSLDGKNLNLLIQKIIKSVPELEINCPKRGGRAAHAYSNNEILEAVVYGIVAGCPLKALSKGLPATSSIYRRFDEWRDQGLLEKTRSEAQRVVQENITGAMSQKR